VDWVWSSRVHSVAYVPGLIEKYGVLPAGAYVNPHGSDFSNKEEK